MLHLKVIYYKIVLLHKNLTNLKNVWEIVHSVTFTLHFVNLLIYF